jgi:hypothetical protein
VLVPVAALWSQGQLSGQGSIWRVRTTATLAGALGAIGAVCIIWAFKVGGLPIYVMPLVFGGAPLINALVTMLIPSAKAVAEPAFLYRLPFW